MSIFVISRGLRSCADCDEHFGYFTEEAAAEFYCKQKNEEEVDKSFDWFYTDLPNLDK
jgi:hypothetical protein